jgi:GNAT superfamily N-acetyltransferase
VSDLELRDLSATPADRALLHAFYRDLYVAEFPDPDERESLANIERYLDLKDRGWYGANNYHVALLLEDGRPVGGSVSDYLAEANAGVIEFLVVERSRRGRGVGRRLLEWTEQRLAADARERTGRDLDLVVAEMNDPFKSPPGDSLDPFLRLRVWDAWGYAKLDFPYVQPALSSEQKPVAHLLLAIKRLRPLGAAVPAPAVRHVVHEYLRWAMRIEDPETSAEFRAMARWLEARPSVGLVPLGAYVGHDDARPLFVREVTTADDPDLEGILDVYRTAFPPGPTAVPPESFLKVLGSGRPPQDPWVYHLWALRASRGGPVAGMTSFFTLPGAGFGGYVAFGPPLRGAGRLPLLLPRVEEQMVRDGRGARGWYVECEPATDHAARFSRAGFHEVAVRYRQPRVAADVAETPVLQLLYKEFGAGHGAPALDVAELLEALSWIFRAVYGIERPREDPLFVDVARQLAAAGSVPFR